MLVNIYGAGSKGRYLKEKFEGRGAKVGFFIDRDENKHGKIIDGCMCIGLKQAISEGLKRQIVVVSVGDIVVKELCDLGFENVWNETSLYMFPDMESGSSFYKKICPFNYYESPYPDIRQIIKNEKRIFDREQEVKNINFNEEVQLKLYNYFSTIEPPFWEDGKDEKYRYTYNNVFFCKGSADALYYMMRYIQPKNIIEVGSGFSTAVMLDSNNKYFDNKINIQCIEPNPERLYSLLREDDNVKITVSDVQELPLDFFEVLDENDILFIDSSHVSKLGSDVNFLLFEVIPRLKSGVYIHFHDMFYPFIYPKEWMLDEGRAYNELYLIRAFLMNNKDYSIQLFGDYVHDKLKDNIPASQNQTGNGSLWIKKN